MPMTHLRKAMLEELQRRNLSAITTRIYLHSVEEFAQYFNTPPDRLGLEPVPKYQAHLYTDRKLEPSASHSKYPPCGFSFSRHSTAPGRWTICRLPNGRFDCPKSSRA